MPNPPQTMPTLVKSFARIEMLMQNQHEMDDSRPEKESARRGKVVKSKRRHKKGKSSRAVSGRWYDKHRLKQIAEALGHVALIGILAIGLLLLAWYVVSSL